MTTVTKHAGITATGTGPKLEILRNLVDNPRAATNLTGFAGSFGTGGAGTITAQAAGGPLPEAPSFVRRNWTAAQTAVTSGVQCYNGAVGKNNVAPSTTYVCKAWVRSTYAAKVQLKFGWYADATYKASAAAATVTLAANVWTMLTLEGASPADANRVQLNIDPVNTADNLVPAGTNFDISAFMLFAKPAGAPATTNYLDGDMGGCAWLATAHASQSEGYGALV